MARLQDKIYRPNADDVKRYDLLFQEYKLLHDYFGRGENNVMKRLKVIKNNAMRADK
jgi:L-ribulokinase